MSSNVPRNSINRIHEFLGEMLLLSIAEQDPVQTPRNEEESQGTNMQTNPQSSHDQDVASQFSEILHSRENHLPERDEDADSDSSLTDSSQDELQDSFERFGRIQWLLLQPFSSLSEDASNSGLSINIFHIYGGLRDSVINQLRNQLDCAGVPPAEKAKIDSLPLVKITQQQVDSNLVCAICLTEFILDEQVKQLYCTHQYHGKCIDKWLLLHGNCPKCREDLNGKDTTAKDLSTSSVDFS